MNIIKKIKEKIRLYKIELDGRHARLLGKNYVSNPYPKMSVELIRWVYGWKSKK